jgi:hypothetical protein
MADAKNRRECFRLRYPESDRPLLMLGQMTIPVAELSETGMRVVGEHESLWVGALLAARIRFADSTVIGVQFTVVRREDTETILKLTTGVPLRRMLLEQRRVHPSNPAGDEPSAINPRRS